MKGKETEFSIYNSLVEIHKEVTYSYSTREEECHGFHTFIEQDELSNEVVKVVLKVNGSEIDITTRLTKEELVLLNIDSSEVDKID
jgi:hypothetical protein